MRSIVAIVGLFLLSFGCTRHVTSGEYGPFTIGHSKLATYEVLEREGIRVDPHPYPEFHAENPTRNDLVDVETSHGLRVWINKDPYPLRIQFENSRVLRTWPVQDPDRTVLPFADYERERWRLQQQLPSGISIREALDVIAAFDSQYSISVATFAPEDDRVLRNSQPSQSEAKYRSMLMKYDRWSFSGLEHLAPFDPYYSTVDLYFESGELVRVKHWMFPFELL